MRDFHTHWRTALSGEGRIKEWIPSVVLAPFCVYYVTHWGEYTLLDNADLVIHEAGHFFMAPFGRFLRIAGGTLMQLFLPGLLVWHFAVHAYRTGSQVAMLWLGQNLINISVYAADARTRVLPLLGGDRSGHDWWNMLRMTGLLEHDATIAGVFVAFSVVCFVMLLAAPLWLKV